MVLHISLMAGGAADARLLSRNSKNYLGGG